METGVWWEATWCARVGARDTDLERERERDLDRQSKMGVEKH